MIQRLRCGSDNIGNYENIWNFKNNEKQCFGSRSVSYGPPGSGFFHHEAKIVRKTFISTVL
jgi:hypothetical protein